MPVQGRELRHLRGKQAEGLSQAGCAKLGQESKAEGRPSQATRGQLGTVVRPALQGLLDQQRTVDSIKKQKLVVIFF